MYFFITSSPFPNSSQILSTPLPKLMWENCNMRFSRKGMGEKNKDGIWGGTPLKRGGTSAYDQKHCGRWHGSGLWAPGLCIANPWWLLMRTEPRWYTPHPPTPSIHLRWARTPISCHLLSGCPRGAPPNLICTWERTSSSTPNCTSWDSHFLEGL